MIAGGSPAPPVSIPGNITSLWGLSLLSVSTKGELGCPGPCSLCQEATSAHDTSTGGMLGTCTFLQYCTVCQEKDLFPHPGPELSEQLSGEAGVT